MKVRKDFTAKCSYDNNCQCRHFSCPLRPYRLHTCLKDFDIFLLQVGFNWSFSRQKVTCLAMTRLKKIVGHNYLNIPRGFCLCESHQETIKMQM